MSDGSGPPPLMPFARFGPDSGCSRILQGSLAFTAESPSAGSSPRWPKQGMWALGAAFALPMSALPTVASGYSSSPLLPTPTANNFEQRDSDALLARRERVKVALKNGNGFGLTLGQAVSLLPTPRASDSNGSGERTVVSHLLPTPTTQPHTGNGHARNLAKEVQLLPTPTASDAKGPSPNHSGTTAEAIADLFSGASTEPPSTDGSDSTDPPLTLFETGA